MSDVVSTWADDMKVLTAIHSGLQQVVGVRLDELADSTGLSKEFVYWSLGRLEKGGYLSSTPPIQGVGLSALVQRANLTDRGMRTAGMWPSLDEFQAALVRAFERQADSETEPAAKIQWVTMAKLIAGEIGKAVLREGVGNVL